MAHLIEVAFRGNRKEFFQWTGDTVPPLKAGVIVEADRGEDFGRVHATGELAEVRCKGCAHGCGSTPPPRSALRLASREETLRDRELDAENESSRRKAMERVKANGLVMKLTDAEWQWDRRKLTIYFTAERRVDFRGLVRDLAALFRTRIELKQIGVRDEARRLSGIGRCGREYCSASWLPDLRPVNLGVAKDQKLSLNPQQISGACGRLMCCLRYEHEFYVQSRRRFPKEGKILQTSLGEERVLACDIFNERVTLRTADGDTRVVALADLREEIGGFGEALAAERSEPRASESSTAFESTIDSGIDTGVDADIDAGFASDQRAGAEVTLVEVDTANAAERVVVTPMHVHVVAPDVTAGRTTSIVHTTLDTEITVAADTASDAAADASSAASDVAEPPAGEPRRKRRRGRRGGRRLRAAEQRRAGESPESATANDATDAGDDDEGDDESPESPTTS